MVLFILTGSNMPFSSLSNQLWDFDSHGLADLDKASLMNRVDTKFVVPTEDLPEMLRRLQDQFSILEINGKRCFHYHSIYYDTPDYLFYSMHHNRRLNRYKVRVRHYVDSGTSYLEVKFKNNKGRTEKNRAKLKTDDLVRMQDHESFLQKHGVPHISSLVPALENQYYRIALASEERAERLTIDLNLTNLPLPAWREPQQQTSFAVLELKQARIDRTSPFFAVAKDLRWRPSGFSKYCMGLALAGCVESVKYNRFKPIIHRLKRTCSVNTHVPSTPLENVSC
ncbi:VTC domain-containing protein [Saccharophagus sp. K07]|nr:VTC domain-containing protein [Saccharophagus sp. K07]